MMIHRPAGNCLHQHKDKYSSGGKGGISGRPQRRSALLSPQLEGRHWLSCLSIGEISSASLPRGL